MEPFHRGDGEIAVGLDRSSSGRKNNEMHGFLRLLLSFAVLACPLNCMGALGDGDTQAVSLPGCSCCSHGFSGENSVPHRLPHAPNDDCQCPTCLCNGAVLLSDDAARDVEMGGLHVSCDVLVEYLQAESPVALPALAECFSGLPTSLPSGRCVRILHQSFLL